MTEQKRHFLPSAPRPAVEWDPGSSLSLQGLGSVVQCPLTLNSKMLEGKKTVIKEKDHWDFLK